MDKENVRILFMGTPEIAAHVLSRLLEQGFHVIGVVCNEDKPTGRKKTLTPPPTKVVALEHNIPVYQPHRIREDHAFLNGLEIDLILTMAYGQIVPQEVLDAPKFGALNLHGSILPKLRGAAPMQRAIIEGHKSTGVSLMKMVDKMDAGEVYDTKEFLIEDNDTYGDICNKMAEAAAEIAIKDILLYIEGKLPGIPQNESEVTFANKIKSEDEHLPLDLPRNEFRNWVRGLSPTPGGYLFLEGKKLKILACSIVEGDNPGIGVLTFDKKSVCLGLPDGLVRLDKVQLEGKGVTDGQSFANGYRSKQGCKLE